MRRAPRAAAGAGPLPTPSPRSRRIGSAWRPAPVGWLLAATILLAGCAGLGTPGGVAPEPDYRAWEARREALRQLEAWTLVGRVALRTAEESWSATLHWRQRGGRYRIRLIAPLSQGTLEIAGDADGVVLTTARGEVISAADPETLLQRELGWRMPVAGLRYWILGRDDPGRPVQRLEADAQGRPVALVQDGWAIRYGRYTAAAPVDLPARLEIEAPDLSARLVVTRWQTGA